MTVASLLILLILFFVTSIVGVVTGSNSLITVPAMFQAGIDPRVAIATNMFGLTFMSVGGALPFVGRGVIDRKRLPATILLTIAGSIFGALLVLVVPTATLPLVVSISMLGVALFSALKRDAKTKEAVQESSAPRPAFEIAGYALTLALGIYGGFFSGGYITMLTAAYVWLFRMSFVEAVSTTKVINVFSSLVATLIFMSRGLVDYKLGVSLAVVMFVGAYIGGRVALRMNDKFLRRVFLLTVVLLACKILLYDLLWKGLVER
ncbi:MAG: sulfite exporter TauE/SafE family protein [Pyrinomonadaceae bacterium]|nr:sulfite exporter TauE/SafE family protein [Pyrinomonadaceae bacterium]